LLHGCIQGQHNQPVVKYAEVLFSNNCSPFIYATKNKVSSEREILQNLLAQPKLDGILVEGTKTALPNPNLDLYRRLQKRGIPLVFFNGNYRDLDDALFVLDDNYGGGYQLVDYLHNKGHTRIAGIFKSDDIQGHQRYFGYISALRDIGLPIDDNHVLWYTTENKDALLSGVVQWQEQLEATLSGCTAVVCYNDEIASLLIQSLLRMGYKIPKDMAVVSFDNSRYSYIAPVQITSLSHGKYNVGRIASEILVRLLAGEPCQSQFVPWELVEKESS